MGREVKRVALDFSWPMNQTYEGFLLPQSLASLPCPDCERGYNADGERLHGEWYGRPPVDQAARGNVPHTLDNVPGMREQIRRKLNFDLPSIGQGPGDNLRFYMAHLGAATEEQAIELEGQRMCDLHNSYWSCNLTQAEVDWIVANDEYGIRGITHKWNDIAEEYQKIERDTPFTAAEINHAEILTPMGLNHMGAAFRARCAIEGLSLICETCGGDGESWRDDAHKAAHEAWEPTEPPAGDGWQMWENTSEGSPISPVFATAEELAQWLTDTNASSCGSSGATYEQWMAMIGNGWAPSLIIADGKMMSGVEAAGQ